VGTQDVFPRLNRPVREANFSEQPNSNHLQNTIPLVAIRQPELKQGSIISQVPIDQSFSSLHFTSLLAVPVFTETLRMYPIFPFLDRLSCSDYELPASNGTGTITLPAGTGVYIPVLGLHHDPKYFPEPEKFDPDRFTEENNRRRANYTHIPFGEGPRMCIGKDRQLLAPHKNFRFLLLRS
jgi:cytochrome P450